MLPLEKKQSRDKLLPYSDLHLGVFLEEKLHLGVTARKKTDRNSIKIGTWNIRPSIKDRSPKNCKRRWRRWNAKHWHQRI
jgi:hypothetical protein